MSIELASITKSSFMMVRWSCVHWCFGRRLFVLACTPPPGLTTSHACLRSLLVYWLSHLAVGSGSVWTRIRRACQREEHISELEHISMSEKSISACQRRACQHEKSVSARRAYQRTTRLYGRLVWIESGFEIPVVTCSCIDTVDLNA